MTASEFEALRADIVVLRQELRHDIVRLEAKIDSMPSMTAMFTAIAVTVFALAGVIASTIASLHSLGFFR
jgi:uncharacterized membrane protein